MIEIQSDVSETDKLSTYLHWSQLCYQYAEFVDQDSLSSIIEAITNAKDVLTGTVF